MKRMPALLLVAAMLGAGETHAQARGRSAAEVRENGQEIISARAQRKQQAVQEADIDEPTRAQRVDELSAWLRRLPGRFSIRGSVQLGSGPMAQGATFKGGIADCSGIGTGPGVNCIINVRWPFLTLNNSINNIKPSPTEYLNTMQPAMLVFGLSQDPPGVVSQMVTGDSVVLGWFGKLQQDTLASVTTKLCLERCIGGFRITAEEGSDTVTFDMKLPSGNITFIMQRDPDAQLEQKPRPLQAR